MEDNKFYKIYTEGLNSILRNLSRFERDFDSEIKDIDLRVTIFEDMDIVFASICRLMVNSSVNCKTERKMMLDIKEDLKILSGIVNTLNLRARNIIPNFDYFDILNKKIIATMALIIS